MCDPGTTGVTGNSVTRALARGMRDVLRQHAWFLAIVSAYVTLAAALAPQFGATLLAPTNLIRTAVITLLYVLGFLVVYPLYIMIILRPERPFTYFLTQLKEHYVVPERLLAACTVLVALTAFATAFSFFKSIIAVVRPFAWDTDLARVDRFIHFGHHPWQLLHAALGRPAVTIGLDLVYLVWFFVMSSVVVWMAFSLRARQLRMQFFLSYVLCWIFLGNLMALACTSAGPCYYGSVQTSDDPYQPLLEYLHRVDEKATVRALFIQDWLWNAYRDRDLTLGHGISAMPSMHVAATFLLALVGWRSYRPLGAVLYLYMLLILIGSVHLGWHYAVDGYVAIPATWIIWQAAGWLAHHTVREEL